MIIINMACGLANRMFQYCYYMYLRKMEFPVAIDFYKTAKLPHENVPWKRIFPNAPLYQASRMTVLIMGGGGNFVSKIRRKYLPSTTKVLQMPTAFDAILPHNGEKDVYVIGVFQNAEMIESIKNDVFHAFTFPAFSDNYNLQLAKEIRECESVAIHVRKGKDYTSRVWYRNTCPLEYYRKAITLIRRKFDNARFYVFTDNVNWVKENFSEFEYRLIDENPSFGWGCHFDMQLMSLCRHNIISNSTYSWWGAFLNQNPNKTVICPSVWFNPQSCEEYMSSRLLCQNWVAL